MSKLKCIKIDNKWIAYRIIPKRDNDEIIMAVGNSGMEAKSLFRLSSLKNETH